MTWNPLAGNTRGARDDEDMATAVVIVGDDDVVGVGREARQGISGLLVTLMREFMRRPETARKPRRANMF